MTFLDSVDELKPPWTHPEGHGKARYKCDKKNFKWILSQGYCYKTLPCSLMLLQWVATYTSDKFFYFNMSLWNKMKFAWMSTLWCNIMKLWICILLKPLVLAEFISPLLHSKKLDSRKWASLSGNLHKCCGAVHILAVGINQSLFTRVIFSLKEFFPFKYYGRHLL